ncbi:hypothetical protein WOLCODRAFT_110313 [Wolfiporia cocos MD-104 SS10]|uniref:Uncharacterized protein n=1 Tax=Wolfiporia cocos (strain MD-104) TaxID=742152 RepID=A0A2H3JJH6_WOLCO|nr:hypothetical protein WOLCODRAFT_110313 [Wolfiporia cocos MD-104 SS10]
MVRVCVCSTRRDATRRDVRGPRDRFRATTRRRLLRFVLLKIATPGRVSTAGRLRTRRFNRTGTKYRTGAMAKYTKISARRTQRRITSNTYCRRIYTARTTPAISTERAAAALVAHRYPSCRYLSQSAKAQPRSSVEA